MLDISISEIIVVGLVGLIVLGPKEMVEVIRSLRKIGNNIKEYYNEFLAYLSAELGETPSDDYVKIILDQDGNPQKVYDLEKIKPYLKDEDDPK
ncbi:MAG: twin-arginine translocase TatA/TatE family subunit [Candidatus Jidaibacter sp.]|jgi:sec-independent protein translocase protein TatB|nr:twin-arginine translocase TatA/TatE family subunit [Candidatus Jidaibacter sp.]